MEKQTPSETVRVTRGVEFLRASINHQGIKLDVSSKNATQTLADIRRIMECLSTQDLDPVEDFATFEVTTMLSEEFTANTNAMQEMRRLLNMEQRYRVVKELIGAVEEIDFINGKKSLCVDPAAIKRSVNALVASIDVPATKHALIHIKGLLSEQERLIIVDRIHERIPHAQIKAFQTEQDIEGKVLVEALLFGDYECDEVA